MQNIELITPSELSDKLKVKKSTVTNWIKYQRIPESLYFKIGTVVRFYRDKFEDFYEVDLDDLLTIKEAAFVLRTNENTLKSWFFRKQLPEKIKCNIVVVTRIRKSMFAHLIMKSSVPAAA